MLELHPELAKNANKWTVCMFESFTFHNSFQLQIKVFLKMVIYFLRTNSQIRMEWMKKTNAPKSHAFQLCCRGIALAAVFIKIEQTLFTQHSTQYRNVTLCQKAVGLAFSLANHFVHYSIFWNRWACEIFKLWPHSMRLTVSVTYVIACVYFI